MRLLLRITPLFLFSLFTNTLFGQMTTTSGAPYTPESLIETVFLGDGVEVTSIQYEGDETAVGFFEGGLPFIGMESGVVMTTGNAADTDQNGSVFASGNIANPAPSNGDLEDLLVNPLFDINDEVRYTITFIPFSDTLRFNFAFGSEEYPEYVCQEFNDVFGFFISGPGINGPYTDNADNIALIPGTNFPVAISYVNPGVSSAGGDPANCMAPNGSLNFSAFYNDNNNSNTAPVYDGYTTVFTAEAVVIPCQEYTIRLAIADAGDGAFDSGVFLEAKSFGGSDFDLTLTNLSLDGTLAEGCDTAFLNFEVDQITENDRVLPLEVFGTATPGLDYTTLPDSIFIPAGESIISFPIAAFEDNLVEGIETIQIVFQRNLCRVDTIEIKITDNLLEPSMLPDEVIVCIGDTITFDATLPVVSPPPPRFESSGSVIIGIPPAQYSSTIELSNILPATLQEGVIKNVCIDSLTHQWISDLDVFLVGPNGQILELTTDNGEDGGNSFGEDAYINTCFTPAATNSITGPGTNAPAEFVPFTGDWLPEGNWADLYDGNFSTNGTWELRIIDDQNFGAGRLWKWSICLEPIYEINYEWSPGDNLSTTEGPITDYLGVGETTYYVTATDSYGCELIDTISTVYQETPLMQDGVCGTLTDSSIQINWFPVEDAVSYEVQIAGGDFINVGNSLSYTFNGLLPSTDYTFFIRADFDPCPSPEVAVTCTTLPCIPPVLLTQQTDLACAGDLNGTITSMVSGGRAPYTYFLNGVEVPSGDITGLGAGTYELIATDTVGCADTALINITAPEAIAPVAVEFSPVSCNGENDAVLVAQVSGGVAPYNYSWNGIIGTDTLAGQGPGTYSLIVEDSNGCSDTTSLVIGEPDLLSGAVVQTTTQNCVGPPDGTISTNALGGTPPYSYNWNDPSIGDTGNPTGLEAGDYSVTVTDAGGCFFELSMTVGLEASIVSSGSETDILCNGAATGEITTNISVGQGPFNYDWTGPGNPTGNGTLTGLVAGTYQVVITDNRGCLDTLDFSLTQPDTILGSAETTDVNCSSPTSGGINWSGFGGVQPYNFNWSNGMSSEDLENIPTGTYDLVLTDANGCVIEQSYFVDFSPAIELETIIDSVSCFGADDGGIFARLENAEPPYVVNYVNAATQDTFPGLSLNNAVAGTYQLVGEDAFGCPINESFVVPQPAPLQLQAVKENIRCAGEDNGLIELSASGGTPFYQYRVGDGAYQTNGIFIGLPGGRYPVSVRDDNGCVEELSPVEIIEPEPLELDLGDDLVVVWGDSVQIFPNVQGGSGNVASYEWIAFDSSLVNCLDCAVVFAKPNEQTTLRLRITDDFGCTQEDFLTLFINKDYPVLVPTGFTPNGDGENDRLIVHGVPGTTVLSFQVFNRWGGLVYEKLNFPVNETNSGWDGTFEDEPASGTFVWQVQALLPDGTEQRFHGQSTLIR